MERGEATRGTEPTDSADNACAQPEKLKSRFSDLFRIRMESSRFYYAFAHSGGLLYTRLIGSGSLENQRHFLSTLIKDKAWSSGIQILGDIRWVEETIKFDAMFELTRELDNLAKSLNKRSETLVLITKKDLEYGISRMYQSLNQITHKTIQVVRDIDSAIQAVGADPGLINGIMAEIEAHESAT